MSMKKGDESSMQLPAGSLSTMKEKDDLNSPTKPSVGAVPSGMTQLTKAMDRIQEQSIIYSSKIEIEEKKAAMLDQKIKAAEARIKTLYGSTRGGKVIVDDSIKYKKNVAKLEKSLQSIRISLSKSQTENMTLKRKIIDARTDKLLYLQIHADMVSFGSRTSCRRITISIHCYKWPRKLSLLLALKNATKRPERFPMWWTGSKS